MKFIPYSAMILIPLADLLIPFYMILFPNSMPTQFLLESQVGKKTSDLAKAQAEGYERMLNSLSLFANVIGMDPI